MLVRLLPMKQIQPYLPAKRGEQSVTIFAPAKSESSAIKIDLTSLAVEILPVEHGRVSRQHASILNLKDIDSSVRH